MDESWQQQFSKDASLFPHLFDVHTDRLMLSRLTEQHYKNASFLDQRILPKDTQGSWIQWDDLAFYTDSNPPPQFIFHLGHVGSTLLSRLLGDVPSVLALREPQLLRHLTDIGRTQNSLEAPWSADLYKQRTRQVLAWLSRRYRNNQTAMIKASSFVSEIAGDLIGDRSKSLFVVSTLERYLETILAGDASLREMHMLSASRLLRLQSRLKGFDTPLWQLSLTQKIAVSWLCELTALTHAQSAFQNRVLWLDFDRFLQAPVLKLLQTAHFFGHDLTENEAHRIIHSPIMASYSKAPEHQYSPDLRRQLLEQARRAHGQSIETAISWVEELANTYPVVKRALTFSRTKHVQKAQAVKQRANQDA